MDKKNIKFFDKNFLISIENVKSRLSQEKINFKKVGNENFQKKRNERVNLSSKLTNNFFIISILLALFSLLLTVHPLFELITNSKNNFINPEIKVYKNQILELKKSNDFLQGKIKKFDRKENSFNSQDLFFKKNAFIDKLKMQINTKENQINLLEEDIAGLSSKAIIQEKQIMTALKIINDLENQRDSLITIIKNQNFKDLELSKINF